MSSNGWAASRNDGGRDVEQLVSWFAEPDYIDLAIRGIKFFDECDRRIANWVSGADAASFDELVALAGRPPATATPVEERGWDDAIGQVLGEWARLRPDDVIPKLPDLMRDTRTRSIAADALWRGANPNVVRYVEPILPDLPNFPEDDAMAVVDALGDNPGPGSIDMLRKIKGLMPPERASIHDEIAMYLAAWEQRQRL